MIRLFFFIILFVKRVTICMGPSMDESIHSASRSFASRHPFVFSLPVPPSSFVPFALTVASDVHYLQLSRRKSVPLIFFHPFFGGNQKDVPSAGSIAVFKIE